MYVELMINGRKSQAMGGTNGTHNFLTETKRLGLAPKKIGGHMKYVNSKAKPIQGVAMQVKVKLED